jgi:hypothetical protein
VKLIDGPAVQQVKSVSGAQGRDLEGDCRCQAITLIIPVNEISDISRADKECLRFAKGCGRATSEPTAL